MKTTQAAWPTTTRYRDVVERELYEAQRRHAGLLHTLATTNKVETAELSQKLADATAAKIGRLTTERDRAPIRPRDGAAGACRPAGPLDPVGIRYGIPDAAAAACGNDPALDIPDFLRRTT